MMKHYFSVKNNHPPANRLWRSQTFRLVIFSQIALFFCWVSAAVAQQGFDSLQNPAIVEGQVKVALDTVWVLLTAFLVFFMNAGFAMLESGFCRHKNVLNILSKNLIVFALSSIAFWMFGFAIMFGDGNSFLGFSGWLLKGADNSPSTYGFYQGVYQSLNWTGIPLTAKFFFQLVFAGTAATIVSGAVAERIKFVAFIFFSLFLVGFLYPITGHWIWGGGWLQQIGFFDFAGSTVVHSVGGWAALVGTLILGPRLGRYQNGSSYTILGHSYPLSTLGCLILWLGWFGFNPGSTMAADPFRISHIVLTTNTAIVFSALSATIIFWLRYAVFDLTMIINGVLGGAVAVTAGCQYVNPEAAAIIGIAAGVVVVFGVDFLDKWRIDDPVGAISVHLFCGIWGTLAVGLFADGGGLLLERILEDGQKITYLEPGKLYALTEGPVRGLLLGNLGGLSQLWVQFLGVFSVGLFTAIFSGLAWYLMASWKGIRVTKSVEQAGLDLSEHGFKAYGGFRFKDDEIEV